MVELCCALPPIKTASPTSGSGSDSSAISRAEKELERLSLALKLEDLERNKEDLEIDLSAARAGLSVKAAEAEAAHADARAARKLYEALARRCSPRTLGAAKADAGFHSPPKKAAGAASEAELSASPRAAPRFGQHRLLRVAQSADWGAAPGHAERLPIIDHGNAVVASVVGRLDLDDLSPERLPAVPPRRALAADSAAFRPAARLFATPADAPAFLHKVNAFIPAPPGTAGPDGAAPRGTVAAAMRRRLRRKRAAGLI